MKTDDRDMDSSNPSKNFKVGDFDHLSGFFTPVWESNRRVHSESTAPAMVTASAGTVRGSAAPDSQEPAAPTLGEGTSASSEGEQLVSSARKAGTRAGKAAPSRAVGTPPSPARAALRQAGPSLSKEDYIDSEPEFRAALPERAAPPRAVNALTHQRSLRASAVATVVHERLKAKLSEVVTPPDVDSAPVSARGGVLPVTPGSDDVCPPHVLRQLRRTLRLSTQLPESVRALVAQYNRN